MPTLGAAVRGRQRAGRRRRRRAVPPLDAVPGGGVIWRSLSALPRFCEGGPVTPTSAAAPEGIGLPAFNALPDGQARELLLGCCHAGRWAAAVAGGRPYPTLGALLARAGAELADGDVAEALAGHPRIGRPRVRGTVPGPGASRPGWAGHPRRCSPNSPWPTRRTRSGSAISIWCAERAQRGELLGILNQRLRNGPDEERNVVRGELRAINALRLTSLIGPPGPKRCPGAGACGIEGEEKKSRSARTCWTVRGGARRRASRSGSSGPATASRWPRRHRRRRAGRGAGAGRSRARHVPGRLRHRDVFRPDRAAGVLPGGHGELPRRGRRRPLPCTARAQPVRLRHLPGE